MAVAAGPTSADDPLEHGVHIIGGALLQHLLLLWLILQQDHFLPVHQLGHPGIGPGIGVNPGAGEGGVSLGHRSAGHAGGQAAHGHGGDIDIAHDLVPRLDRVHQIQFELVLAKGKALLRGNIVGHHPDRDSVG